MTSVYVTLYTIESVKKAQVYMYLSIGHFLVPVLICLTVCCPEKTIAGCNIGILAIYLTMYVIENLRNIEIIGNLSQVSDAFKISDLSYVMKNFPIFYYFFIIFKNFEF